jgi:hypothetical protein
VSKVVKLILNNKYINYKYFANITGTIYGNRLPKGTQVKKSMETSALEYSHFLS